MRPAPFHGRVNPILGNSAESVRAGSDQQWGIILVDGIEMNPNRDHRLQNFDRRLDVLNASFESPRGETLHLDFLVYRNRPVLMPTQGPIGFLRFVEEYRANGSTSRSAE